MKSVSRALIVGGGIAGLASAIALQRVGVQCEVIEIGDLTPVGASIGIAGRAPNALDELGVYDRLAATSKEFDAGLKVPVMHDRTGRALVALAAPANSDLEGGKEPMGLHRPVLAEVLADTARSLGASIETGITFETLDDRGEEVVVALSTGEVRHYDFVVGADGVGSRTRSTIFPEAPSPEYAGQMSVRWLFESGPIDGEGWYLAGEPGKVAFYHLPKQGLMYSPMVINMPDRKLSQLDAYEVVRDLLDNYTAPAIVELRSHLTPESELIARPFKWILLEKSWHRGRVVVIGDAAHATTAHMGMGGGMALEDAVVLAQCIEQADSIEQAFQTFFERRFERVRAVVETSVALSKREQQNLPPGPEDQRLMQSAMAVLASRY